jgi:hypothetical protein
LMRGSRALSGRCAGLLGMPGLYAAGVLQLLSICPKWTNQVGRSQAMDWLAGLAAFQ